MQTRIRARNAQDTAAYDFDDLTESRDVGDELADLYLGARELHDKTRRVRRQHPAAHSAQQGADRLDMIGADLQLDQQQFTREMIAAGHILDRHYIHELQQLSVDLR